MRIRQRVAGPQKQRRLLAAIGDHRFHHAAIDFRLLDAGLGRIAAGRQHEIPELRGTREDLQFLFAFHRTQHFHHIFEIDEFGLRQKLPQPGEYAVRQPAVRIERARKPVHADARFGEAEFAQPLDDRVRPSFAPRPHVGHPILSRAPAIDEGRHHHIRRRLADARKHQHIEFGIAADRRQITRIGGAEIPHRGPAPQHQTIEAARLHLLSRHRPAAIALGKRQARQFQFIAHLSAPFPKRPSAILSSLVSSLARACARGF